MRDINWEQVSDVAERPTPGGYLAVIKNVEDVEDKEYLRIEWEFAEGPFKGSNQSTFDSYGFWPYPLIRSYKQKALPFFKGFKTVLETTNRNYKFDTRNVRGMIGKGMGVVLGEETYIKKDGTEATRLYVAEVRSADAIRKGDYKVPELRAARNQGGSNPAAVSQNTDNRFQDVTDDEDALPF